MAGAPRDDPNSLSFEAHLGALGKVVADLEGDALSLEASIERYRVGVDHLSACRRILDGAERRLAELVQKADGSGAQERPLAVGADGLVDAGPSTDSGEHPAAESTRRPVGRAPKRPATPAPGGAAGAATDGAADGDIPF